MTALRAAGFAILMTLAVPAAAESPESDRDPAADARAAAATKF